MSDPRPPISDLRSPLFVLVAGEASGDLLGAELVGGLRRRFPDARFAGIGGPAMAAAGMEIWHPAELLSVMGLVEVLPRLPRLLALRRDVLRRTLQHRPAAFIGIDAPDFNLGLERKLKAAGIRTVHYVSPSIWAWREKRAERIGASADRVLCLFPIEPPIYARHGVDARFVGHPLAGAFPIAPDKSAARAALGLPAGVPVLALLPGSRLGEIRRLGRDFLAAAALLARQFPDLYIVAPMANERCRVAFEAMVPASGIGNRESANGPRANASGLLILSPDRDAAAPSSADGDSRFPDSRSPIPASHLAMIAADAVLLASGTAALEAMLAKRPMVVAYRLAALSYRLIRLFGMMRTSVYSLPNILAGRTIVPELMQADCTPEALARALAPALASATLDPATLAEFTRLHESLRGDPAHDAAGAVAELVAG
jgi:lipid-A-disaccharide synthase